MEQYVKDIVSYEYKEAILNKKILFSACSPEEKKNAIQKVFRASIGPYELKDEDMQDSKITWRARKDVMLTWSKGDEFGFPKSILCTYRLKSHKIKKDVICLRDRSIICLYCLKKDKTVFYLEEKRPKTVLIRKGKTTFVARCSDNLKTCLIEKIK